MNLRKVELSQSGKHLTAAVVTYNSGNLTKGNSEQDRDKM